MSATNRGGQRRPSDFYPTPFETLKSLLDNYDFSSYGLRVLEPSAGNGNVCKMYKQYYPKARITAIELDEGFSVPLQGVADSCYFGNFLTDFKFPKYDVIIGNPPFSLAQEFVEKSLTLLDDNGVLVFLLRTSFLESKKRHNFWQKNLPSGLLVLSDRPSFTGKGTDAASYAWFIWEKNKDTQFIRVI